MFEGTRYFFNNICFKLKQYYYLLRYTCKSTVEPQDKFQIYVRY